MTRLLKREIWRNGTCIYFIEKYYEKFASVPHWRYGEYTSQGKVVQSDGLLKKPSKKLNYFQLS